MPLIYDIADETPANRAARLNDFEEKLTALQESVKREAQDYEKLVLARHQTKLEELVKQEAITIQREQASTQREKEVSAREVAVRQQAQEVAQRATKLHTVEQDTSARQVVLATQEVAHRATVAQHQVVVATHQDAVEAFYADQEALRTSRDDQHKSTGVSLTQQKEELAKLTQELQLKHAAADQYLSDAFNQQAKYESLCKDKTAELVAQAVILDVRATALNESELSLRQQERLCAEKEHRAEEIVLGCQDEKQKQEIALLDGWRKLHEAEQKFALRSFQPVVS